jgi:hypothetical protein
MACSSYRFLDRALLSFQSQRHSTALPSAKRYDKRYEEKFLRDIRPHQLPTSTRGGTEDVEVGDASLLTSFNIDGEDTTDAL